MFDIGWLGIFPRNLEVRKDAVVAVVASHLGFWSINVNRIVYIVESEGSQPVFGFAYGTLPEHVEIGEERFTVSWSPSDDSVWYEILALSKPRHVLARIGYPFSRILQKRFGNDSLAAMRGRFNSPSKKIAV
jgi:uncharacterized protein (UPF0548 family)